MVLSINWLIMIVYLNSTLLLFRVFAPIEWKREQVRMAKLRPNLALLMLTCKFLCSCKRQSVREWKNQTAVGKWCIPDQLAFLSTNQDGSWSAKEWGRIGSSPLLEALLGQLHISRSLEKKGTKWVHMYVKVKILICQLNWPFFFKTKVLSLKKKSGKHEEMGLLSLSAIPFTARSLESTFFSPTMIETSSFPLRLFWFAISFLAMPWYVSTPMTERVAIEAKPVTQLIIASQMQTLGVSPVLAKSAVL